MGNPSDNVIVPPLGRLCKVRPEVFLCYVKNAAKKFPMKVCSAIGAERNKPCSKRKENSAATVLAQCTSSLIKSGELKCVSWPMAPIYGAKKDGFLRKKDALDYLPILKNGKYTVSEKSPILRDLYNLWKETKNIKECRKTKIISISLHGAASRSYSTGIFKRLHSSKCKKLLTAHRVHITQSVILKRFYPICTKLQKEKKYFLQTKT